tara:strand:- start:40 stop:498 length:459 start_codon:yes stop_codon:yes gene_type:complete
MEINSLQSILNGEINQLPWGSSKFEMENKFPKTININKETIDQGVPFLVVDNTEFYYGNEDFSKLSSVIIQAWKIEKNQTTILFDHTWINGELKFKDVVKNLEKDNLKFLIYKNAIIVNSGARFLFYNTEETIEEEELCKVILDKQRLLTHV